MSILEAFELDNSSVDSNCLRTCRCALHPTSLSFCLNFALQSTSDDILHASLVVNCTACHNKIMTLKRYGCKLDSKIPNLLCTLPSTTTGNSTYLYVKSFSDSVELCPQQCLIGSETRAIDFEMRDTKTGKQYQLRVDCRSTDTIADKPNFQTFQTHSKLSLSMASVLNVCSDLHMPPSESDLNKHRIKLSDMELLTTEVKSQCKKLQDMLKTMKDEESVYVKSFIGDTRPFTWCHITSESCSPYSKEDLYKLITNVQLEATRLLPFNVCGLSGMLPSVEVLAREYNRIQKRISWDGVAVANSNRGDLVNVRAYYIALRAIESHIAQLVSPPDTKMYGGYEHRSFAYQLRQLKANNLGNSLLLSDATFQDCQNVLGMIAVSKMAWPLGLVNEEIPLLHHLKVDMCVRGILHDFNDGTRYKNVRLSIPFNPCVCISPTEERASAVRNLYAMTYIDMNNRIIYPEVHVKVAKALKSRIAADVDSQDSKLHDTESVKLMFSSDTQTLVQYALLGTPSTSHASNYMQFLDDPKVTTGYNTGHISALMLRNLFHGIESLKLEDSKHVDRTMHRQSARLSADGAKHSHVKPHRIFQQISQREVGL